MGDTILKNLLLPTDSLMYEMALGGTSRFMPLSIGLTSTWKPIRESISFILGRMQIEMCKGGTFDERLLPSSQLFDKQTSPRKAACRWRDRGPLPPVRNLWCWKFQREKVIYWCRQAFRNVRWPLTLRAFTRPRLFISLKLYLLEFERAKTARDECATPWLAAGEITCLLSFSLNRLTLDWPAAISLKQTTSATSHTGTKLGFMLRQVKSEIIRYTFVIPNRELDFNRVPYYEKLCFSAR